MPDGAGPPESGRGGGELILTVYTPNVASASFADDPGVQRDFIVVRGRATVSPSITRETQ